jgi:hypothetical protein
MQYCLISNNFTFPAGGYFLIKIFYVYHNLYSFNPSHKSEIHGACTVIFLSVIHVPISFALSGTWPYLDVSFLLTVLRDHDTHINN